MITVSDALALVTFTAEEKSRLDKLEARIDYELASRFDGTPMRLQFPNDDLPAKLWAALQRRYEQDGGWRVSTSAERREISFVPMNLPPVQGLKTRRQALPPIASTTAPAVLLSGAQRFLVRMPTRGRPHQALEVLAKYRALAGMPVTIEVVLDEDDETMMRAEVLQRLRALDCVITVGRHRSKVQAVNAGRIEWDILLLASDDMVPVAEGYAVAARDEMLRHFPQLDGCIYFDDGYQHANCCTLPIMGRRLYEQFGYVYHPEYKSLWCDQEQTEVLQMMGRLAYVDRVIIEHHHHVTGKSIVDNTYKRNDALWEQDKAVYEERKRLGFWCTQPTLSVLICSLSERSGMLDKLVDELRHQARAAHCVEAVEILTDVQPSVTIGEKRQRLLERARGEYICFVDDDDWIAHDYIGRILGAIEIKDRPDTIAINGVMTTAGAAPEPFFNSMRYKEWFAKDGAHYRTPTHLSPVRRELALLAGFRSMSYGEDHDYSQRLYPLLKTEASAGDAPLYHYFYWPKSDKMKVNGG